MLGRAWQSAMTALARSAFATRQAQSSAWGRALARRFVVGDGIGEALARADALMRRRSIRSSLFYLGAFAADRPGIDETMAAEHETIKALSATPLDLHISVDPTQLGLTVDPAFARANAFALAEAIAKAPNTRRKALALDMEDPAYIDSTIALHDALRAARLPSALTLQVYLKRTRADLERQIEQGSHLRLVKGAFLAPPTISYTREVELQVHWRELIELIFSKRSRERGVYPSIATHDYALQNFAIERATQNGWGDDEWEIEMLLGVRDDLAALLAPSGRRIRLYVPFGANWFPYAMRRVGENPANVWLMGRAMLAPG